MRTSVKTISSVALFSMAICGSTACRRNTTASLAVTPENSHLSAVLPATANSTSRVAVRFLEERVKHDPDDLVALNKLAGYYLQLHRETDEVKYLELSLRAAQASLNVLPADQNLGGLSALALAEFETHNFVAARDHAQELTEYRPQSSSAYQLLGDASLELGAYDDAAQAYQHLEHLDRGSVGTETRLAHFALLHGDVPSARRRYERALIVASQESLPSEETIAWCNWQLGEVRFASGDLAAAENHCQNALSSFPDYPHAISSLARLRVAQGDLNGAIAMYEKAVGLRNDPVDCAALGDAYRLAGRERDAERQFSALEKISLKSELSARLYNRHLTMFWANHDRQVAQAYARARQEYNVRRDIYTADALAWTAFKVGKLPEARAAMNDALSLGTLDASLFYHAGMIEQAAGNTASAQDYFRRSLKLNPHFDPTQSLIAKKALAQ